MKYLWAEFSRMMWCSGCGIGTMVGGHAPGFRGAQLHLHRHGHRERDGCTGKADDYIVTNALHSLHGRALAYATGVKAFNPKLNVVVIMGDGDGVTIGGNHFIHAARRNMDLTAIILNNLNFGMTGGQVSGTTPEYSYTSTTVYGNPERAFDISASPRRLAQTTLRGAQPTMAGNCSKTSRRP